MWSQDWVRMINRGIIRVDILHGGEVKTMPKINEFKCSNCDLNLPKG